MNDVYVFTEQDGGRLLGVALELLGKGRELADRLGGRLAALLLGHGVGGLAEELIYYGADLVYVADHPSLSLYQTDPYARVVERLVLQGRPSAVLFGATYAGRDLAPTVASRLGTGLSAHCNRLEIDDRGRLVQMVPAFGGLAAILCPERRPQMASVMPGVMRKPDRNPERKGNVVMVDVQDLPGKVRARAVGVVAEPPRGIPLEEAEVVVAGGAGIGGPEGWRLVEELADLLGGAVGATRPPVDEGWARESQMIGQSGKTVRPLLYIAIGISGEMQHMVGVEEAGTIVAINQDPRAPIFRVSDYGIVGDYRKVVPALIKELKEMRRT